jgi:hypothetical protein
VVCTDNRDGNNEIYYKRSIDGGINWGADTRLTNNTGSSESPSVIVSGSVVQVVWADSRDLNYEIYYKRSTDGGVNWGADTRLTDAPDISVNSSVTVSGSVVHVVWKDLRDGNWEIYYKRDPTGNVTGIKNIDLEIPKEFSLSQNYPNPFNPSTKIKFSLPSSQFVTLKVYDVLGREIAGLINELREVGNYEVQFNPDNLVSGIYYYRFQAGTYSETKKLVLLR